MSKLTDTRWLLYVCPHCETYRADAENLSCACGRISIHDAVLVEPIGEAVAAKAAVMRAVQLLSIFDHIGQHERCDPCAFVREHGPS